MSGWLAGAAVVGAGLSYKASQDAADATREAAGTAASADQRALDYLKEREELPQEIRERSLRGLEDFYQVPDQPMSQEELIGQARQSPLYDAIMGSREAGEEAILRNASATGGLRSGRSNAALTDYNMQLENQALLQAFQQAQQRDDYTRNMNLQGISGLAQLPSNANAIASQMGNIGETRAMGIQGAAQAKQQGIQNIINNTAGIAGLGLQAYETFSDVRLKEGITFAGEKHGFNWYRWNWKPEAASLGLEGEAEGVLAHEVVETHPDAVGLKGDFITVDYDALGITER